MTFPVALATVTQAIALTALAVVIGGLALDTLMPLGSTDLAAARTLLRQWVMAAAVAVFVTSAAELVLRSGTMAGGPPTVALGAVPTVLGRTHFGRIWIARGLALGVMLLVIGRGRRARTLPVALGAAVALTTSLTGHAGDRGDVSLAVALDWIHVLAAGAWAGGLICLGVILRGRARAWSPSARARVITAFSGLAGWCLLAVVLTGVYNAWTELPGPSGLWTTGYGRVLGLKLLLVAALVWWGALNRYAIVPLLARERPERGGAPPSPIARVMSRPGARRREPSAALASYLRREAILALAVFGCTAVLVDSEPPHRGAHEHHPIESDAGPAVDGARSSAASVAAHGKREAPLGDVPVDGQHPVSHRVPAGPDR